MTPTELVVGQAFFWVCAVAAIAGALFTVIAKNPIRGAMGLLFMILNVAGIFLALHAQFLAAIQLIVYAGAIIVLFIFVIMLLGPSAVSPSDQRGRIMRTFGAALFAGAALSAMFLVYRAAPAAPKGVLLPNIDSGFGSVDQFGELLFSKALVPFELSSALLMVAIIGAVAVARGHGKLAHLPDSPHVEADMAAEAAAATPMGGSSAPAAEAHS